MLVKKYDEDLNITLIFVSRVPFAPVSCLTCCQFRLRHRRPLGATIRSERTNRSSSPRDPPPSIDPPSRTTLPLFHLPRGILPPRTRVSAEGMDRSFANILKRSSSSASLQKSPCAGLCQRLLEAGHSPEDAAVPLINNPDPLHLLVNQGCWRLSWVSGWIQRMRSS